MLHMDKPWFDDQCRHAFCLIQEDHLRWTRDRSCVNWEEFVRCQVGANETYSKTLRQFSVRNWDVLMNAQSPHKWWSTLKVCCVRLEFDPATACWWGVVGKADLLSDQFDGKQSWESVVMPVTCPSSLDSPPSPSGRMRLGVLF